MSVQLLISTMFQNDYENLLKDMNVQSDALIINQCDNHDFKSLDYNGKKIKAYEFCERGVGLSRNMALMRATSDYCLISDDDMTYVDGYEDIVEKAFLENKDADVIIFNLNNCGNRFVIKKKFKVNYLNFMRFGAARIAIRHSAVKKNGISFNLCYGGGTPHGSGEDVLFLKECIKKKLNIVAVPVTLATLNDVRESTWFKGYDEKFFRDHGSLFACISPRYALIISFLNIVKNHSTTKQIGFFNAFKCMIQGIRNFKAE